MALRKLLLILSLFIIGDCFGQSPMFKLIAKRQSSCSYLLDQYSGAAAAYSLRKLDCDYAGSAIRVRRSSDNTESDIGFTSAGDLDTSALKIFVGTGGTDDGFVVTWYDQSGNSRNASQSTAGNQPIIMDDGVIIRQDSYVSVKFDGSRYLTTSNTGVTTLATHSEFIVFKQTTQRNSAGVLVFTPASGNDYQQNDAMEFECGDNPSLNFLVAGGSGISYLISKAGTSTIRQLISHIISSGNGEAWQNGSSVGTDSYASFNAPGGYILIGARYVSSAVNTANYGFIGVINEIIIYNSAQSSNRTSIQSNINTYYSVY